MAWAAAELSVGLANYSRILNDRVFVAALSHNLQLVALAAAALAAGAGPALLVRRITRGRALFRTVFFLPFVLSEVVTGVIWNFIYRPDGGLVDLVLQWFVPGLAATAWMANPNTVLYALFGVVT